MSPLALLLSRGGEKLENPLENTIHPEMSLGQEVLELNVCTLSPEIAAGHLIFFFYFFFLYMDNVCPGSFPPEIPTALSVAMLEKDTKLVPVSHQQQISTRPRAGDQNNVFYVSLFSPWTNQHLQEKQTLILVWLRGDSSIVLLPALSWAARAIPLERHHCRSSSTEFFQLVVMPERTQMDAQTPGWT